MKAREKFVCSYCSGALRDDLNPMCPICKSRDVQQLKISVHFD